MNDLREKFEDFCEDKPELTNTVAKVDFLTFMKSNPNYSSFESGFDAFAKKIDKHNLDQKIDSLWERGQKAHDANYVEPTKKEITKENLEDETSKAIFGEEAEAPINVEETSEEMTDQLVDRVPMGAFRTENLNQQNKRINAQVDENRQNAGIIK